MSPFRLPFVRRSARNLFLTIAGWCVVAISSAATPPNILFILTDDQGSQTLSCYGNRHVETPHLDALARDGMRFTAAYATPQCTPTRASLLTGQHTARNRLWHVLPWYGTPWAPVTEPAFQENLPRDTFTLPKGLRAAGYVTGIIGKWHLTRNEDGDYNGLKPAAGAHYGFDFVAPTPTTSANDGDKHVRLFTDHAIEFIERHRDQRWFLYLAHHTVHNRVVAPAELVAAQRARGAPESGLHNATYLAALQHLDNEVGRLLARLDELRLRENTLVVFVSDNGGVHEVYDVEPFTTGPGTATTLAVRERQFDNAPFRAGKGSPYEGGLRVPCLVRWPAAIKGGAVNDTPVHAIDWLPTLFEVAGARAPASHPVDGVSLAPLLRGEAIASRALFWHLPLYDLRWGATPCSVVRDGDWKLIEYFGDRVDAEGRYRAGAHLELFNLADDIGERNNLAARQPERAAALQRQLRGWLKSLGAEIPTTNPRHDPARALKEVKVKPW